MDTRPITIDDELFKTQYQLAKKSKRILSSSKCSLHLKTEATLLVQELMTLHEFEKKVKELKDYLYDGFCMLDEGSSSYTVKLITIAELRKLTAKMQKRIGHKISNNINLQEMSYMKKDGSMNFNWTGIDERRYVHVVEVVERHLKKGSCDKLHTTFYVALRKRLFSPEKKIT